MHASHFKYQKQTLRKHYRSLRRGLNRAQQKQASRSIKKHLLRLITHEKAKHIAIYWPSDGEVSLLALRKNFACANKRCYLPRIKGDSLEFHLFSTRQTLKKNRYNIPEPLPQKPHRSAQKIDIVCMPLVAFDLQGHRLGMGGGFYDRCFAFKTKRMAKSPLLVGIAHQEQQALRLPVEKWDVPLDYIVSNRFCLKVKKVH